VVYIITNSIANDWKKSKNIKARTSHARAGRRRQKGKPPRQQSASARDINQNKHNVRPPKKPDFAEQPEPSRPRRGYRVARQILAEEKRTEKKTATRGKSAQSERAERGERTIRRESADQGAAQASPSERGSERAPQREKAVK